MLGIPLGERIHVFFVGNVEVIFKNWFRLSMPGLFNFIDPRVFFF